MVQVEFHSIAQTTLGMRVFNFVMDEDVTLSFADLRKKVIFTFV